MKRTIRFFGAILILVKLKLALDYIPFNNCLVSIAEGTLNRNQFREALSSRMHRTTDASREGWEKEGSWHPIRICTRIKGAALLLWLSTIKPFFF